MDECIFCSIIHGKLEAAVVFEDKDLICILDRYPMNPGHALVITKRHYKTICEMSSLEVGELFSVAAKTAKNIVRIMKADGFNIGQNNGIAAHQLIFHVHVHIIPRYFKDAPEGLFPKRHKADFNELKKIASLIQKEMSQN